MNKGMKFTLGVASVLLTGVLIGVLIAPEKGSELRKKLKKQGEDLLAKGKGLFQKISQDGEEILEDQAL
ncbi:MAG: YtxH domain-containing protein [Chitinophagaceae bacterium]|nr:YtxH domain-containing protein [Chitinophagaceae bacterium]MBN8668663.1 YtxH domain-containing protein [Chitinophagales bacterium]